MSRRFAPAAAGLASGLLLVGAGVFAAGPASADGYARFGETSVTVSPTCAGTTSAEAMLSPLQEGDRVEMGVRVAVHFSSDNHAAGCALTTIATWHNLDTDASGSDRITVASTADPATGGHYGSAGYGRANFWTGPGAVLITVGTHPDSEMRVTV